MYKNVALHHFSVWQVLLAVVISLLALLATFYQLYLQRVHNAKSLKPLAQIAFEDRAYIIAIRLFNYGLGPLIVDKITFTDGIHSYNSLKEYLDLDVRSYNFASMDDLNERVILPEAHLVMFERHINDQTEAAHIKAQLTPVTLRVEGRDIYDKRVVIQRSFHWFSRH